MIDAPAILAHDFGRTEAAYTERDAILYALGLGLGADPLDRADLRFLDERALAMLPSFAVTLGSPGMWIRAPRFGVDFARLVHAAQWAEFPAPMPAAATVQATARVLALTDRGTGKGAELLLERQISDARTGTLYGRLHQTLLLRGDGGFGGPPARRTLAAVPDGEPDAAITQAVSPRAALIYRLSGDWNPLHCDPDAALAAGFPRPILHGLASYGMAGVAVSRALGRDPASVTRLACRFSGVVFPGDIIAIEVWRDGGDAARFRARVDDRTVLDRGEIAWSAT